MEKEGKAQQQCEKELPTSPSSQQEEETHDWKEGARIGEADHPGPPKNKQPKGGLQGTRTVPETCNRPWGQKKQQPRFAPPAYQARGVGWPHQKQPQPGTSATNFSVASGQRWRTGTTPTTRPPNNAACGVTRYDGRTGLNQLPPKGMQTQNYQKNTNPNPQTHTHMPNPLALPCQYGMLCWWKDLYCPYQHPQKNQPENGWNNVGSKVRCWFGAQCQYAFCPYEHPWRGGDRTQQRLGPGGADHFWDPHLGGKGNVMAPRPSTGNYWQVLGQWSPAGQNSSGSQQRKFSMPVAAGGSGEHAPCGSASRFHQKATSFASFARLGLSEKAATGRSTSRPNLALRGTRRAVAERRESGGQAQRAKTDQLGQRRIPAPGREPRPSLSAPMGVFTSLSECLVGQVGIK